ncbi:hypothetical protein ACFX13_032612 [Malus domestica]
MRGSMVLRLALIFTILSMAASIDDKCTAYNAVAEELELRLSKRKTQKPFGYETPFGFHRSTERKSSQLQILSFD